MKLNLSQKNIKIILIALAVILLIAIVIFALKVNREMAKKNNPAGNGRNQTGIRKDGTISLTKEEVENVYGDAAMESKNKTITITKEEAQRVTKELNQENQDDTIKVNN